MICNECGNPMLLVYTAEEGWVWICSKCWSYAEAAFVQLDMDAGQAAYRAFMQYQEGEYEAAEKGFCELTARFSDPDWQMGCCWYALLSRYGFAYTHYGKNYAVNLWRFPLPDQNPECSQAWQMLSRLIIDHGCHETVKPLMNVLRSEISALSNRLARRCEVYINCDVFGGSMDGKTSDLGRELVYQLGLGDVHQDAVACFFPQMHGSQMQNYGATAHAAMEDAALMIVLIGSGEINENSPFSAEINAFWKKSGMNCRRVLLCMENTASIDTRIPKWMRDAQWNARWCYAPQESVGEIANRMVAGIREELNLISAIKGGRIPQEAEHSPQENGRRRIKPASISVSKEADAAYQAIRQGLAEGANRGGCDFSWVPDAERFWNEQDDVRFAGLLLRYYVLIKNRTLAEACYERLMDMQTDDARKVAMKALSSPIVRDFLGI